jgi:hypothetical protein
MEKIPDAEAGSSPNEGKLAFRDPSERRCTRPAGLDQARTNNSRITSKVLSAD